MSVGRGERVLLVEDEMLIAMMLEDLLEELGFRVAASAARADQALVELERETPDLAVLDVNLDGGRSYPVADKLAKLGVPFLFVTGYDLSSIAARFRDRPALRKPVHTREFADALSRLIGPR